MTPEEKKEFDEYIAKMTRETVFLVEATSFEQSCLWEREREHCRWEEYSRGFWETIGKLDDRPVTVSIGWARINGRLIAFYDATSQVVDHVMVDGWVRRRFGDLRWDGGTRRAHCDAMNFHHALDAIREMNGNRANIRTPEKGNE